MMSLQKNQSYRHYTFLIHEGCRQQSEPSVCKTPPLNQIFMEKIAKNKLSNKSTCIIILSCLDFWRETHLNSKRDHHFTNVVGRSSILSEKDHRGGGMQIIIQQMLLLLVVLFLPFNLQLKNPQRPMNHSSRRPIGRPHVLTI